LLRIFCFFNADIFVANTNNENLTYDFNSNINRLVRTNSSGGNMADFTYYYSGNKLSSINGGTAYTYDLNGNTTTDGLRGVSIAYNILNLPKTVSKKKDNIAYIYSAAGEKLARMMKDGTYQYYAGNMVYKNDKSLNYLLFDEGLVNKVSGGYSYEYHLKDHLGNTRVTFQPYGSTTTTTQVAEYYPFGSSYLPVSPAGTNKYLYNGKEKQDDVLGGTALDWYDYGARFYDAQIGRFTTQDRFAEKYFDLNPYQYCANNPIRFLDVNGDSIGVNKSITDNWALNYAFKLFATSKAGRAFLGQYAHKGQTLYGQTFDKSGKYDEAGLNLNYTSEKTEDSGDRGGTIDDDKNTITITVNSYEKVDAQDDKTYDFTNSSSQTSGQTGNNMSRWIFSRSMTFFHESFIHGDLSSKDYIYDKKFNNSNIIYKPGGYEVHWQHSQVLYNNAGNTSWPGGAYNGIKEVNSTFGQFYTNGQLKTMMWNYDGGKPTQ